MPNIEFSAFTFCNRVPTLVCVMIIAASGLLAGSRGIAATAATQPNLQTNPRAERAVAEQRDIAPNDNGEINRLDNQTKLLEQRLDLEGKSTDQYLRALTWLGGLITFIFAVWGFLKEKERRQDYLAERDSYEKRMRDVENSRREDYENERRFYEARALAFSTLQEKATLHAMDISRHADIRQERLAGQEASLSDKFLARTDQMLTEQLANVGKLGEVIGLVNRVFSFQLQKEEKQQEVLKSLNVLQESFAALTNGFGQKYSEAATSIMKLERVKAMNWSGLSPEDLSTAAVARQIYDGLLDATKIEEEKKAPYRHARILQLMGITAYYANDIDSAFRFLQASDETYRRYPNHSDYTKARGYTKHFLGVVSKSWQKVGAGFLQDAKQYLENASDIFKADVEQFLTPVTLAEVYSYIDDDQAKAREKLISIVHELKNKKVLDPNQRAILIRSYLLMGNLESKQNAAKAREYFTSAREMDPQNPFAELSLLYAGEESSLDANDWKTGLELLERSQALEKRETTTKMTVLVWATVAAYKCGNLQRHQEYLKEFEGMGKSIRDNSDLKPYSFSPLSKKLITFKELNAELQEFLSNDKK